MSVWWTILRTSLEERLVYRGDFAIGTMMRFLPIVTQIFLWAAIFNGSGGQRIGGMTYHEMVAYYMLTLVSRAFSSMPGLANQIAALVRTGDIKKFLIQPVDLLGFLFLSRVAHKLAYYMVATGPFILMFYLARGFFSGWPDATTMAAFILSLLLGYLLGFFLEACLGLVAFWFLEVGSLLFVYMLFSFFRSGHMFTLDILGQPYRTIVFLIPLHYLAYFPAAVFLGKVQGWDLVMGLSLEAFWVAFFFFLARFMFRRGVKRYSAFGG